MGKWTWKHFTVLLFEELPFTGFSIAAIKIVSGLPKIKDWGFFLYIFSCLWPSGTWYHLHSAAFAGSAADLGHSPCCAMAWSACLGLLGGTLFGAWLRDYPSICKGLLSIPNHDLTSCYNLPYFCTCHQPLAVFFSLRRRLCIRLQMRMSGTKSIPTPRFAFVKLSFHGRFPERQFAYFIHC